MHSLLSVLRQQDHYNTRCVVNTYLYFVFALKSDDRRQALAQTKLTSLTTAASVGGFGAGFSSWTALPATAPPSPTSAHTDSPKVCRDTDSTKRYRKPCEVCIRNVVQQ